MTEVVLKNITKKFKDVTAVNDVSFDIADGEFFVLLGPTGAGKTTTLRLIAGLDKVDDGEIMFDGQVINELTPASRDVAMVFQQYSLYPNKTVYDNLAFPLRSPVNDLPEDEIKRRVEEACTSTEAIGWFLSCYEAYGDTQNIQIIEPTGSQKAMLPLLERWRLKQLVP